MSRLTDDANYKSLDAGDYCSLLRGLNYNEWHLHYLLSPILIVLGQEEHNCWHHFIGQDATQACHGDRIWLHYILDFLALSLGRVLGRFHSNSKGILVTGKWAEYGRDSLLIITILKRKYAKHSIGEKMQDVDCFKQSSWIGEIDRWIGEIDRWIGEIDSGKQWDQQKRTEMWMSGLCAVSSLKEKNNKKGRQMWSLVFWEEIVSHLDLRHDLGSSCNFFYITIEDNSCQTIFQKCCNFWSQIWTLIYVF